METATYQIPTANLHRVSDRLFKINKRAKKLGLPEMKLVVGEVTVKKLGKQNFEFSEVTITGEYPVINGWRIIGTIDHSMGKHLISTYDDFDVKRYRTMEPVCEHCNQHKITVTSYLVENVESGDIKAVGRSCLKNYLDADPKTMLTALTYINDMMDELGNMTEPDFDKLIPTFDVKEIMAIASFAIRNWGFVKSREEGATSEFIMEHLISTKLSREFPVEEKDYDMADATIKHFLDDNSDTEFNFLIKELIDSEYVTIKYVAHLAGAVFGYTLSIAKKASRQSYTEGYVGEVKKRMEATLILESIKAVESFYGVTYIHNMIDSEGHKLTWFASGIDLTERGIEIGKEFTAKFTPKSHEINSYDSAYTTTVNRLAIVG